MSDLFVTFLATILEELPGVCDMLSNRIADGNFTVPESSKY